MGTWERVWGRCGAGVLGVVAAVLVMSLTQGVQAEEYSILKDPSKYGNLDQDDIPQGGQYMCGPTAAVNSFIYLQTAYPGVYDTSLVPLGSSQGQDLNGDGVFGDSYDDMIAVAMTLAGAQYMNTKPNLMGGGGGAGTWDDMFIYGKTTYFEFMLPNHSTYAAQMKSQWGWVMDAFGMPRPADEIPPIPKPWWVQDLTQPDAMFLYNELNACEDVEILIVDGDWGHYLTVTGLQWNDVNGNQLIESVENAWIYYIDPATGAPGASPIGGQLIPGDPLRVNYGLFPMAELVMTVSESPIPEPGTMMMLGTGLMGLAGMFRRRRLS